MAENADNQNRECRVRYRIVAEGDYVNLICECANTVLGLKRSDDMAKPFTVTRHGYVQPITKRGDSFLPSALLHSVDPSIPNDGSSIDTGSQAYRLRCKRCNKQHAFSMSMVAGQIDSETAKKSQSVY